ncbi:rhamnosyltransferase WsaF family glycosyltransferase [Kordiimonas aestuarii]|uniref:rhamnosyltransferase WsaF family glycosyltransferase n=1 Tax=Kordiimonas aestuarii TaxID=1005925 RepID=UPI0021CED98F|nr:glycosyltransferase [Kordiimonas aestuarii]
MTAVKRRDDEKLATRLLETGLIWEEWYGRTYAMEKTKPFDLALHFVSHGAQAGNRPNPLFNPAHYAEQTGISDPVEAVLHFAEKGWKLGFNPSKSFLVEPYLEAYPDIAESGVNPLLHYLRYGRVEGRRSFSLTVESVWRFTALEMALPADEEISRSLRAVASKIEKSKLFDQSFYIAEYGLLLDARAITQPALHYAVVGERLGLRPNPYFDVDYYAKHAKVRGRKNLLLHYLDKGWKRGLSPSEGFDGNAYLKAFSSVMPNAVCPLMHYLTTGHARGYPRIPVKLSAPAGSAAEEKALFDEMIAVAATGLFDSEWYMKVYEDLKEHSISSIEHFVRYGLAEGRGPNAHFDVSWYRTCYGQQIGDENPVVYYAREGYKNGQWPAGNFSPELYFLINRDLREGKVDALRHFIQHARTRPRRWPNPDQLDERGRAYLALSVEERNEQVEAVARSGLFDAQWYAKEYGYELTYGADYIEHYLIYGGAFGYRPNRYFDIDWYVSFYQDAMDERHPLVFFAETGWRLDHSPGDEFDETAYRELHKDLADLQSSMLAHYLHVGRMEGRELPEPSWRKKPLERGFKAANGDNYIAPVMQSMTAFDRAELAPQMAVFNQANMDIHWVMPDFSAGGGGHMTIFRMISFLERQGHRLTIWIHEPSQHKSPEQALETIHKHFQFVRADVRFIDSNFSENASGDALVATDCWSVWPVMSATNFLARFYFVQDFEPSFHPMGGKLLAAELTYKQDLHCICASPWLAKKLHEDYGRDTSYFYLAADQQIYHPADDKRDGREATERTPRIAFYSRIATDRRAVELGLLGLELLARQGVDFHVDFFGNDMPFADAPFSYTDHGVASTDELAALFQATDIGVVFSATNYSLVPQEMMACGLPIVELDGENTRAIYPEDIVTWAEPDPWKVADAVKALLSDRKRAATQASAALEWVSAFSWAQAGEVVEQSLKKVAAAAATARAVPVEAEPVSTEGFKASVVIPTYNAGAQFERVLDAILSQHAPWPFEVLVIDSGSTDGTLDIVKARPDVRLHEIDKRDFNHGDTRNLGASLTSGDYIAFVTHDALPANRAWLFNLVEAIEAEPKAAGAFGRHFAYPEASPFTKRDLDAHFTNFQNNPLLVSRKTNVARYKAGDEGWRQFLHFYSDNNSCFRRSIWEKIPYRRVEFGEDQLWAHDIIEAGYAKLYAAQAVVYHSHDYDEAETEERSAIEASFFRHFFGYQLVSSENELSHHLEGLNAHDEHWGEQHRVSKAEIEERKKLNAARLQGYLRGTTADTSEIFADT